MENEENVDQVSDFESDAISQSSEEHSSDDTTVSSPNGVNDSIFGKIDDLDSEIRRDIAESDNILNSDSSIEENDGIDFDADSKSAEVEDINEVEEISFETETVRPSREAKNKGIDRLQVSFNKKSYDSKRQYQFIMREVQKCTNDNQSYIGRALKVLFTQMTAKAGIKKHGEIAIAALMKEFKQLVVGAMEGKPVVEAVMAGDLSNKDKREALEAVNLIKEKRDGSIKGRTCANGAK